MRYTEKLNTDHFDELGRLWTRHSRMRELMRMCVEGIEEGEEVPKIIGKELREDHKPNRIQDGMALFLYAEIKENKYHDCSVAVDVDGSVKLFRNDPKFTKFFH